MIRSDWPWDIRLAIRKAADGDHLIDERSLNCVRMYRAVICRAIADAYGMTGLEDPGERRTSIREAREFFWHRGEWFDFLFLCAGIDPNPILLHMLTLSPVDIDVARPPVDRNGKIAKLPAAKKATSKQKRRK